MKLLSEKIVNTEEYGGTVDLISGLDDFKSTCTYNEEWHTYRVNGKIVPSVTQILDDGSYQNVNPEVLKQAQDRGTLIHKEIEAYVKRAEKGFTDEFEDFLGIYTKEKEKFENEALFDIKTYAVASPKNREKCYKQLQMYADAIEYLTGKKIRQFYMIHLPKNRKARLIDLTKEFKK
jgi:hypothetical protein